MVNRGEAIYRFNKGCKLYQESFSCKGHDYEDKVRSAAHEICGAQEWILKVYLIENCELPTDVNRNLIKGKGLRENIIGYVYKYGQGLSQKHKSALDILYKYRNGGEHNGFIVGIEQLYNGIQVMREILITYLDAQEDELATVPHFSTNGSTEVKDTYYRTLISQNLWLEFTQSSIDNYIPLNLTQEKRDYDPLKNNVTVVKERVNQYQLLTHGRVVVLADAGAGKTSLLRYLAYSIANNSGVGKLLHNQSIPVVISLSEFAARTTSLYRYLVEELYDRQDFQDFLAQKIKVGGCCLMLDGLDEIPHSGERKRVVERIQDFSSQFPENSLIITSRKIGYNENQFSKEYQHLNLEPLDDGLILEIAKSYFIQHQQESLAKDFMLEVRANPKLHQLASTPLLLVIMLSIKDKTNLPTNRTALYQAALSALINRSKVQLSSMDKEELMSLLQEIAFTMLDQGYNQISKGSVETLSSSRPELVDYAQQQAGILVGDNQYSFVNYSLMEYLASCHLARLWQQGKLDVLWLKRNVHQPQWYQMILMATESMENQGEIILKVLTLKSPYEFKLFRDLFLAAEITCQGGPDIPDELVQEVLFNLYQVVAMSTGYKRKELAIRYIARINSKYEVSSYRNIQGSGIYQKLISAISPNYQETVALYQDVLALLAGRRDAQWLLANVQRFNQEAQLLGLCIEKLFGGSSKGQLLSICLENQWITYSVSIPEGLDLKALALDTGVAVSYLDDLTAQGDEQDSEELLKPSAHVYLIDVQEMLAGLTQRVGMFNRPIRKVISASTDQDFLLPLSQTLFAAITDSGEATKLAGYYRQILITFTHLLCLNGANLPLGPEELTDLQSVILKDDNEDIQMAALDLFHHLTQGTPLWHETYQLIQAECSQILKDKAQELSHDFPQEEILDQWLNATYEISIKEDSQEGELRALEEIVHALNLTVNLDTYPHQQKWFLDNAVATMARFRHLSPSSIVYYLEDSIRVKGRGVEGCLRQLATEQTPNKLYATILWAQFRREDSSGDLLIDILQSNPNQRGIAAMLLSDNDLKQIKVLDSLVHWLDKSKANEDKYYISQALQRVEGKSREYVISKLTKSRKWNIEIFYCPYHFDVVSQLLDYKKFVN